MQLKNTLGRIDADSDNLGHGRLPLFEIFNDLTLAHSMPSGAVHPNRTTRCAVASEYCASRVSPWIPGLVPLAQERSLHSPGTRAGLVTASAACRRSSRRCG